MKIILAVCLGIMMMGCDRLDSYVCDRDFCAGSTQELEYIRKQEKKNDSYANME